MERWVALVFLDLHKATKETMFGGVTPVHVSSTDGAIGFCPVFDDLPMAQIQYPHAEFIRIEMVEEE